MEQIKLQEAFKMAEIACKSLNIPVYNYQYLIVSQWVEEGLISDYTPGFISQGTRNVQNSVRPAKKETRKESVVMANNEVITGYESWKNNEV